MPDGVTNIHAPSACRSKDQLGRGAKEIIWMGRCVWFTELVESAYRGDASRAGWTTEADLLDGQRTDAEELASHLSWVMTSRKPTFFMASYDPIWPSSASGK